MNKKNHCCGVTLPVDGEEAALTADAAALHALPCRDQGWGLLMEPPGNK